MKNKDLIKFREALNEVDYIKGKNFAYAVVMNKSVLDLEMNTINERKPVQRQPHPDFINYENERKLLCEEHCEKDENGNPLLTYLPNGAQQYKILDMEKFSKEHNGLAAKYQDVVRDMENIQMEMETEIRKWNELMEQDCNIDFKKINVEDLPEDINAYTLEKIKFMIS